MDCGKQRPTKDNHPQARISMGKPAPSKWDEAHNWLVSFSRGDKLQQSMKASRPRDSNADDRRLIAAVPPEQEVDGASSIAANPEEGKTVGREASWRTVDIDQDAAASGTVMVALRSVCLRDMGTEMTPMASHEHSRATTPVPAATPASRSPMSSGSSSPLGRRRGLSPESKRGGDGPATVCIHSGVADEIWKIAAEKEAEKMEAVEKRAAAWDEAQRSKYLARYRQDQVRIHAWENHEKRKAESEMRKVEMMAVQMKAEAQEQLTTKMAAIQRTAEERRANAEARLKDKVARVAEKAENIRTTGRVPPSSSISFKLYFCWY